MSTRVLVVAATDFEVQALLNTAGARPRLREHGSVHSRTYHNAMGESRTVDVLVTGIGMVPTAVHTARALALTPYTAAINVGLCGSFDAELTIGSVVHITSDRLAEVGAEDGDEFLTLSALALPGDDVAPFEGGAVMNRVPLAAASVAALPCVRGLTVNTVHGADASIARVRARWAPQVESMEGAAFLYACLTAGVPCAQLRAVSNRVERRNKAAWDIPRALAHLADTLNHVLRDV